MLMLTALAQSGTAQASAISSEPAPAAQTVAAAINQVRINAGLPPLTVHPLLTQAAQGHAVDMVTHSHFSHTGTDGSDVNLRVRRTGYGLKGWSSENWVSVSAPGQAIQWWMNSAVHRRNILNPNWREFGVGARARGGNGQIILVAVFATGHSPDAVQAAPVKPAAQPAAADRAGSPYTVRPGDTLMGIAQRHGMSWQALANANGLNDEAYLQIGQVLYLPGVATQQTEKAAPSSAPHIVDPLAELYTVQPGDTLLGIAATFHVDWPELAAINGLDVDSLLQIGQTLQIPRRSTQRAVTQHITVQEVLAEQARAETETTQPAAAHSAYQAPPLYHVVQPGETLNSIAARYGMDWQTLRDVNGLSENGILQAGQPLQLQATP